MALCSFQGAAPASLLRPTATHQFPLPPTKPRATACFMPPFFTTDSSFSPFWPLLGPEKLSLTNFPSLSELPLFPASRAFCSSWNHSPYHSSWESLIYLIIFSPVYKLLENRSPTLFSLYLQTPAQCLAQSKCLTNWCVFFRISYFFPLEMFSHISHMYQYFTFTLSFCCYCC